MNSICNPKQNRRRLQRDTSMPCYKTMMILIQALSRPFMVNIFTHSKQTASTIVAGENSPCPAGCDRAAQRFCDQTPFHPGDQAARLCAQGHEYISVHITTLPFHRLHYPAASPLHLN